MPTVFQIWFFFQWFYLHSLITWCWTACRKCITSWTFLFNIILSFFSCMSGKRIEETLEATQCPKALDARQAWRCLCMNLLIILSFCVSYIVSLLICIFHLSSCILFLWLCRHQNHHLDPTNQGSACPWSLSCETDWSMHSHIEKWLPSWCSAIFLLMARLGQTRHILVVLWVFASKLEWHLALLKFWC